MCRQAAMFQSCFIVLLPKHNDLDFIASVVIIRVISVVGCPWRSM